MLALIWCVSRMEKEPGMPLDWVGGKHAVFVSPQVTAPSTRTFTTHPLTPGTYVLQLMTYGLESTVRLIVR